MKITAVKTYLCNCFRTNWVFVKIETDSDYYGWGEATLEYKERSFFPSSTCHGVASGEDGTPPLSLVRRSLGEGGKPFPGIYLFM